MLIPTCLFLIWGPDGPPAGGCFLLPPDSMVSDLLVKKKIPTKGKRRGFVNSNGHVNRPVFNHRVCFLTAQVRSTIVAIVAGSECGYVESGKLSLVSELMLVNKNYLRMNYSV